MNFDAGEATVAAIDKLMMVRSIFVESDLIVGYPFSNYNYSTVGFRFNDQTESEEEEIEKKKK